MSNDTYPIRDRYIQTRLREDGRLVGIVRPQNNLEGVDNALPSTEYQRFAHSVIGFQKHYEALDWRT